MKIRTQLIAGILIFAFLLIVISGFIMSTNQQLDTLMLQEDLANNVALEVGELGYLSNDYILYREPLQEERWKTKYAAISSDIARFSGDNPEQRAIAANIAANLKNTRAVFDDISASSATAGGSGTGFIQLSWSRMAVQNQGMIFDAGRLARLLREEADTLRQTRLLLIFALMGAFVGFLFTSYFLFYRRTLRSIQNLQKGATIVGSGNFDHTIDESSDDEIGDLARSFNKMSGDLKTVTASKSELEREISRRVQAENELVLANTRLSRSEQDLILKNIDLNALNEELSATQEELQQNVEELTRTEQSLRESEAEFRHVVEYAPASIYEISADGLRFSRVNDTMCRILGYTREELLGMSPFAILDEESRMQFRERLKKRTAGEAIDESVGYRVITKDGRLLWVTLNIRLDCTGGGNTLVVAHDITERKQMEDELRTTLQRFYRILAGMRYGILLVSDENRVEFANQTFCTMFGLRETPDELPGLPADEVIARIGSSFMDTDMAMTRISEIVNRGLPVKDEEIAMQGNRMFLRDFVPVHLDGKDYGRLWIHIDITGLKNAEVALKEAHRRTATILEGIADTFYSLDTGWRFTVVNPAAEKAPFKRPASELLGRVIWDLYPALVGTRIYRHYQDAAENQSMEHYEAQSPLNGRWYEVFMQGHQEGVDVYMRDITKRKEAEGALREALTEKEVLLAEIHHRVKNNLAAFISLLSLEGTYADTDAGRALKKDLQNRARSMALIHETLYRTGKFSNVDMEIYLTTLTGQIADTYEESRRIRIIIDAGGVVLDLARATTAGLIITELITNSFKYAFPPGFDCMAARGEPCTIRVTLSCGNGDCLLTVGDNGRGLPEGLDPLATRSLGLKLVNFLAKHQLRAEITLGKDKGTVFSFRMSTAENQY